MNYRFLTFSELSNELLYQILAHRFEVFVLGQRLIYPDMDGLDQAAVHLIAQDDEGRIIGYLRLFLSLPGQTADSPATFGRLSVKADARQQGLGSELVRLACRYINEHKKDAAIEISAMSYLENFYRDLGFVKTSDLFYLSDVPHIRMHYAPASA